MSTKGPTFDRGFDAEHPHSPHSSSPVVGRESAPRVREVTSWKRFAAYGMVAIMVASAFALLAPSTMKLVAPGDESTPARSEIGGTRDVTYEYSDFGWSIQKKVDNTSLGQAQGSPGINQWWYDRLNIGGYDDTVVRNQFPYVLTYGPYGYTPPPSIVKAGFYTWTFYRMHVDALNLNTIQTGPDEDPIFLPVLLGGPDPLAVDGGWANATWHMTYLGNAECLAIDAGVHYANAYYGVPLNGGGAGTGFKAGYANDGWWIELSGKMDFNRNAAHKFLGLPGTGDLTTEFTTANAGNALGAAWAAAWLADGIAFAPYDIYCAYLYSIDPVTTYLTLDPSSTADKLVVRIWTCSWGLECLMDRYLDVTGVLSNWNYLYPEGLWLNLTMSPDGSDLHMSGYVSYNMGAWKDLNPTAAIKDAAWLFEPMHSDYVNDSTKHPSWISRMRLYIPSTTYPVKKENWMPGTVQFGNRVAYWYAPRNWNLADGEKIVIKLGDDRAWGIKPYKGASDIINAAKATELLNNGVWGELVLGHTSPSSLYSSTYYDHATKTLTLTGPMTFPRNENPIYTKVNETGTPLVPMAISRVSYYTVEMVEGLSEYVPGVQYNVRVTCYNFTGAAATGFYHNVTLSTDNVGTVFGETTHTFAPADSNVWETTVVFGEARASTHVNAASVDFPLDVNGSLTITLIPEFPTLLIPVMGIAAAVVVFARRRKQ